MATNGFNQLTSRLASATGSSNTAQSIRSFNRNLSADRNFNRSGSIGSGAQAAVRNTFGGSTTGGFGSSIRMQGNAQQGLAYMAAPPDKKAAVAILSQNIDTNFDNMDWRVSISVPNEIAEGPILQPLKSEDSLGATTGGTSGGKMVFPFNPTILLGHSASYSQIVPTHTNYAYNAYENSSVDNITITGEFYNENQKDGLYWIAVLHFLRTVTKMFYGDSAPQGNPPPVCRLNGYGPHVLNNIPIVISNFTTDLPADVDYIEVTLPSGEKNMVPVQSQFTITVTPQYSRRTTAKFNLNTFAKGGFVNGKEGFV